jgi:hypothetical protein
MSANCFTAPKLDFSRDYKKVKRRESKAACTCADLIRNSIDGVLFQREKYQFEEDDAD